MEISYSATITVGKVRQEGVTGTDGETWKLPWGPLCIPWPCTLPYQYRPDMDGSPWSMWMAAIGVIRAARRQSKCYCIDGCLLDLLQATPRDSDCFLPYLMHLTHGGTSLIRRMSGPVPCAICFKTPYIWTARSIWGRVSTSKGHLQWLLRPCHLLLPLSGTLGLMLPLCCGSCDVAGAI